MEWRKRNRKKRWRGFLVLISCYRRGTERFADSHMKLWLASQSLILLHNFNLIIVCEMSKIWIAFYCCIWFVALLLVTAIQRSGRRGKKTHSKFINRVAVVFAGRFLIGVCRTWMQMLRMKNQKKADAICSSRKNAWWSAPARSTPDRTELKENLCSTASRPYVDIASLAEGRPTAPEK